MANLRTFLPSDASNVAGLRADGAGDGSLRVFRRAVRLYVRRHLHLLRLPRRPGRHHQAVRMAAMVCEMGTAAENPRAVADGVGPTPGRVQPRGLARDDGEVESF